MSAALGRASHIGSWSPVAVAAPAVAAPAPAGPAALAADRRAPQAPTTACFPEQTGGGGGTQSAGGAGGVAGMTGGGGATERPGSSGSAPRGPRPDAYGGGGGGGGGYYGGGSGSASPLATAVLAAVVAAASGRRHLVPERGAQRRWPGGHHLRRRSPRPTSRASTRPRVATAITLTGSDPQGDPLSYSVATSPSKGTLTCGGTKGDECSYTAGPGQSGTDSFTFTVSDGTFTSEPATVGIFITNQAPVPAAVVAPAPRGVATPIQLQASDPNGDALTYEVTTPPSHGTVTCNAAGACSYTAGPGTATLDSFRFSASDGEATTDGGAVTLNITNQAPVADSQAIDAAIGGSTPITLTGSDPNGDAVTFQVLTLPKVGTLTCNGADCTYVAPPGSSGSDSFTYSAYDGDLYSSQAFVSINLVDITPSADAQALDAPRGVSTPITLTGSAPPGVRITAFEIIDQPTKGTLSCTGSDGSSCTYEAAAGSTGDDTFTFRAKVGTQPSAPATVTIHITNQAPTANSQTVAANAPTTATPITLSGSDPNGDGLTYTKASNPTKGSVSCTGASCTYTADPGRTGTDSFTFTVTDIGGLESTATVTLNLDSTTPGAYIGRTDYVEPESGAANYRGPFVPVTLTAPSSSPVTIRYYTVDGTAKANGLVGDYRQWGTASAPRSITIPAGQTIGYIQPPVLDDALVEGTEQFDVVIAGTSGGAVYVGRSTATVTIFDADSISDGRPILSVADVAQGEGNSGSRTIGFRLSLSKAAAAPVKLACTPTAGTAVGGRDFKAGTKTVTINAGALSATVDVQTFANTTRDGDRSFTLSCTPVSVAGVNLFSLTATGTILDED
ncbi:MAG: Ig-like domain-containing protein [Acidimicrobiales bacterium]